MLTSLTLTQFRGFESLDLPKLARVNLIGGVNNSGKTAILEAIFLLLERDQGRIRQLPHLFRAGTGFNDELYFWRWLVHGGDKGTETSIRADIAGIGIAQTWWYPQFLKQMHQGQQMIGTFGERALVGTALSDDQISKWPDVEIFSPGPTAPIEDAQIYIQAVKRRSDTEERIEALLREIEPRVKRIRAFPDEKSNQPLMHVGLSQREALPASQLGQGFNRLLRIYSSLLRAEAKVFLVDEVETGLHYSVLLTIWKGLAAVARQEDVQIFATTHSREAILAAHRVFSAEPCYDFAYHRLERRGEAIEVVTYDQDRLAGADERNFEIR
jgi:ABC-type transport system involved in cytochrome c biogenesis ATPase subunit